MTRKMLIDAHQPEETRVVLLNGNKIEEFDYENSNFKQLKGNVYLARVTRVEPSLQAAFVEYGGNKQGFLAFSEIHPDYYRIPVEDREQLAEDDAEDEQEAEDGEEAEEANSDGTPEELGGDEAERPAKRTRRIHNKYKIQEVIVRKQILLVQVVKEERGNKGAALTTYLSLAGRYCVLMPNSAKGGGVSRKITNVADRKRLKSVVASLDVPQGMAVIVRTAGSKRTKTEIKRDFSYLSKLWNEIREKTLSSEAPSLIYEEGSLVKRAIRDIYTNNVDEVLVEGEASYKMAREQMKMLIPSHVKRVIKYTDNEHLFQRHRVEEQLETMHLAEVSLKSGGYLVINQTEALVAIDVNSGKATRERNVEEMALKTNLEAADEVGRQLKLRDLAGLIVIDFIDMEEHKHQHAVERRLKDALRHDRARIQVGSISHFGLLEMSRQRLRISLVDSVSQTCPHCSGTGRVRSVNSAALHILRVIEEQAARKPDENITIYVHSDVALYILNQKRASLAALEAQFNITVMIEADASLIPPDYRIEGQAGAQNMRSQPAASTQHPEAAEEDGSEDDQPKRRRRGRRGGRRRKKRNSEEFSTDNQNAETQDTEQSEQPEQSDSNENQQDDSQTVQEKQARPRRSRRKKQLSEQADTGQTDDVVPASDDSQPDGQDGSVKPKSEKPSATDAGKPAKKAAKKKKAAAKKAASKKPAAKKAGAKKAAKKAAKKRGGNDAMETDSTASSEAVEQTEQAGRERKASVEMNVVDVGDVAPSEKKKGWWSR
jgi:ribonuclease E